MGSSKAVNSPSRKDLLLFAAILPIFAGGLGWMSARRPGGLWVALIIVTIAAVIGIAMNAKNWQKAIWALFIPVILGTFLIMGRTGATPRALASAWALVGALLGLLIALTPLGKSIYTFWIE